MIQGCIEKMTKEGPDCRVFYGLGLFLRFMKSVLGHTLPG